MSNNRNTTLKLNRIITSFISLFIVFSVFFTNTVFASDQTLGEAKLIVKNYYVDKIDDAAISSSNSIEELIKKLNDPHTMYFTKSQYKSFVDSINNKFSGIGTHIDMVDKGIKVVSVIDPSPAKEIGILAGDIITEVDGHAIAGLAQEIAVGYLKGDAGTSVHIKILRGSKTLEFDVTRREIATPTVQSKVMDGHVGYIMVSSFGETTSDEFQNALKILKKANVDNYIIDLRNNPGGYLKTALDMAGYFIGPNKALITKDRFDGDVKHYANAHDVINKPIIFLVNEHSASASEVLSGALRDYKKAIFIGNKTYGKGTVQTMFPLSDGSVIKMTIQRFYSPNGNPINKVGIKPDIEAKGNIDPLKTALFLLQKPSNSKDKTGYQLIKVGNRSFEINTNRLKYKDYLTAYNNVLKTPGVQVYVGTKKGWTRVYDFSSNPHKLLYPGYQAISRINNAKKTSAFTVAFSSNLLKSTINANNIQLIDLKTGATAPVLIKYINSKTIRVSPKNYLTSGGQYMLCINTRVRSYRNKVMGGKVIYINVVK